MHLFVDNLLDNGDIRVIAVVCHWDHCSGRQTPAEAPRADLRVEFVKKVLGDRIGRENIRVLRKNFCELAPLLPQLLLIILCMGYQVKVLRRIDHLLRPMAEKLDIGHEVEVRFPERVDAQEVLIDDVDY